MCCFFKTKKKIKHLNRQLEFYNKGLSERITILEHRLGFQECKIIPFTSMWKDLKKEKQQVKEEGYEYMGSTESSEVWIK